MVIRVEDKGHRWMLRRGYHYLFYHAYTEFNRYHIDDTAHFAMVRVVSTWHSWFLSEVPYPHHFCCVLYRTGSLSLLPHFETESSRKFPIKIGVRLPTRPLSYAAQMPLIVVDVLMNPTPGITPILRCLIVLYLPYPDSTMSCSLALKL